MRILWALPLFIAVPALATTLNMDPSRVAFAALAQRAQVAAHVRVIDTQARIDGGRIVSDARCEVLTAGFGANTGDIITVTTLGGIKDNIGQIVFGLDRPAPDEELAVLLSDVGYMHGGHAIMAFSLGLYRVMRAPLQSLDNAVLLGAEPVYQGPLREDTPLTVPEFLNRAMLAKAPR